MRFIVALVLVQLALSLCFVALCIAGILQGSEFALLLGLLLAFTALLQLCSTLLLLWRLHHLEDEVKHDCVVGFREARHPDDLEDGVVRIAEVEDQALSVAKVEEVTTTMAQAIIAPEMGTTMTSHATSSPSREEELTKSLVELRKEVREAGFREERLRSVLRCRSASLMRLASHLTRAQDQAVRPLPGENPLQDVTSVDVEVQVSNLEEGANSTMTNTNTEREPHAKLLELASTGPEMREVLLQRLRGLTAKGADSTESPMPSQVRAADVVARKLAEQAAEMECWKKSSVESRQELRMAMEEVDELKIQLKRREAELSQCKEDLAARKVINVSAERPDLYLKWMEDSGLPGICGSLQGMKRLRQSLAKLSGPAQLCVGPPPADWKVFLQLRLRQTDRWEPALLRLASDGQDSDFLGLLWPTE